MTKRGILALIVVIALLSGCSGQQSGTVGTPPEPSGSGSAPEVSAKEKTEAGVIRIGGLTGPTSMGLVKLLDESRNGNTANRYEFAPPYGSADGLTPDLINGRIDIAALPANLASVLYNTTQGAVKLLAINTLGVLYIVENGESVQTLKDLYGKEIYATGSGSVPEYALNYLLSRNGIDPQQDLTIEWKQEPAEIVALMSKKENIVAMMPQPYVTAAQGSVNNLRIAVDLTREWNALDNGSALITGVFVVRSEFAEQNPEMLEAFLEEYRRSAEYVNANIEESAQLIEEFGIIKAAVAQKALPYCNIVFYSKDEMKGLMEGYLNVLFEQNPKSVGGKLPENNFYYGS